MTEIAHYAEPVQATYLGKPRTFHVPDPALTDNCPRCGLTFGLLTDGQALYLAAHNDCVMRKVAG